MERSFWEEVKAGRYKNEASAMRKAMRGRASRILRLKPSSGREQPVVVKQVSTARPVEALRRVARYIARLDVDYEREAGAGVTGSRSKERHEAVAEEREPPRLFDQFGNEFAHGDALKRLELWGLRPDSENLTPAGEAAHRDGGWRQVDRVGEDEAYDEIQGRHIVVSVKTPLDRKRHFEELVREMVKQTFGEWGYPALVAVHVEHGRELHAHMLVGTSKTSDNGVEALEARPRLSRRAERFTFDRDGMVADALRQALVEAAERLSLRHSVPDGARAREPKGVPSGGAAPAATRPQEQPAGPPVFPDLDASRREDRPDLILRCLAGEEHIRPGAPRRPFDEEVIDRKNEKEDEPYRQMLGDLPPMMRRVVRRAPLFMTRNAEGIAQRLERLERARGERWREFAERRELAERDKGPGWHKELQKFEPAAPFHPPAYDREPAARGAPTGILRKLADRLGIGDEGKPAGETVEIVNEVHRALRERRIFESPSGADGSAQAVAAWQAMRGEDLRFADWALVNAPWLFGEVTAEASQLPRDDDFKGAIAALTDADTGWEGEIRRRDLARTRPEALRVAMRKAVEAATTAVEAFPGAWGRERLSRKAQQVVVSSYVTLADEIEAAFPDDMEMLIQAREIRNIAGEVRETTPLPVASGRQIAEVEAIREASRARQRDVRARDGGQER